MYTFLAESYFHTLDPFAFRFVGEFGLRWYGLSYAVGFLCAWLFIRWMAKTGRSPVTVQGAGDLMFYVIAGVLVGGRLGHVIFYGHGRPLVEFSADFPFWEVLAIHRGGMSSHGGMLGVILVCWLYARRHNVPALHLFDLGALSCTPGFFFGRLANFVNGELWGRALPESMQADPPWWSVKYAEEILAEGFPHLAVVADKLRLVINGGDHFFLKVVEAARAGNEEVIETLRPLLTAYYPSQIFQALTDGLLVATLLSIIWLKPRRPGVVGAWYLIIYGVLRILTEAFRQPDEGVSLLLGLSRGQVLSVLMIVAGAVVLRFVLRREVEPLGGLRKPVKR